MIVTKGGIKKHIIKGSRYYFNNEESHREINLIFKGYNSEKTYSFELKFLESKISHVEKPNINESITVPFQLKPKVKQQKKIKNLSLSTQNLILKLKQHSPLEKLKNLQLKNNQFIEKSNHQDL